MQVLGKTTAVKDGDEYILNGRKCFITNGEVASFYCVTAMTDKTKRFKRYFNVFY